MSCNHPIIDKGVCYYCGDVLGQKVVGQRSISSPSNRLVIAFEVEQLETLELVKRCVVDAYAVMSDDERPRVREQYRKPVELLDSIISGLKKIKHGST